MYVCVYVCMCVCGVYSHAQHEGLAGVADVSCDPLGDLAATATAPALTPQSTVLR